MNGWLLVRIAGIVVGIATLLRLATHEGLVTYSVLFQAWMDQLSGLVELGVPLDTLEVLLRNALEWVSLRGWKLPELSDAWRPVFVLCTLYFGAHTRNNNGAEKWLMICLAVTFALIGAILAGLAENAAIGIVAGFLVAILLFTGTGRLLRGNTRALAINLVLACLLAAAVLQPNLQFLVLLFVAIQALLAGQFAVRGLFWGTAINLVIAAIAAFAFFVPGASSVAAICGVIIYVTFIAIWSIQDGIRESYFGGAGDLNDDATFRVGIDVLGVLFGAVGIASLAANPPIW
jgi:hypothetical protein